MQLKRSTQVSIGPDGKVQGHSCDRGKSFAHKEAKHPMRTYTGTVLSENGYLVPVRSAQEVPREQLIKISQACKKLRAPSEISHGDRIKVTIADFQVDLITTPVSLE